MGKMRQLLGAAMMMMAAAGMSSRTYVPAREDPWKDEGEDDRKRRLHRMNPVDMAEHEFSVGGERIMARDRKTAMKIYANRHPETKGRKQKKR